MVGSALGRTVPAGDFALVQVIILFQQGSPNLDILYAV